ncbi:MAG: SAM-dependent methyltransferase [Clostridiaceae bacterium]|jgi:2-polyprenyl-3-methyl-5-hydroxy-6-metoxy-1,4-benzoquinol methylase|nr:SAM-dependent methyltransferase [Clostridiaceae bacterium]
MQEEHTKINEIAWNQLAYEAWINRFGQPYEAALKIKENPLKRLGSLSKHFTDVKGKKICNLLGSNGVKAVALSLMGAQVTVIDFSYDNYRYATNLAREADVNIKYIVSDVLKLSLDELLEQYDIVFSELGILHYFTDLNPFFGIAYKLLKSKGTFLIEDFHPVSTKLITTKGKKHKINGDYFSDTVEETEVAYMKYVSGIGSLTEEEKKALPKAYLRKWTLGEIVTSIAEEGFCIKALEETESPKPEDKGIPKLFTIKAIKM